MARDFQQIEWDAKLQDDCRQLVRLAVREDLDQFADWTTVGLIASGTQAQAALIARQAGVACGLRVAELVLEEMDPRVIWTPAVADGDPIGPKALLATLAGPARSLLVAERTVLNFVGRLSGVATLAAKYVEAVNGTRARIYDTRKTTPGWRRLEKYAVRCGGGMNHRLGLFDAILIKDNHLALGSTAEMLTPRQAVARAREFAGSIAAEQSRPEMIVEVEVDTLEQLADVLPARPDIVLLDNMTLDQLRQAVALRDRLAPAIELEASGGVNLSTVAAIAATGVERISVGALTHSAIALDVSLEITPR